MYLHVGFVWNIYTQRIYSICITFWEWFSEWFYFIIWIEWKYSHEKCFQSYQKHVVEHKQSAYFVYESDIHWSLFLNLPARFFICRDICISNVYFYLEANVDSVYVLYQSNLPAPIAVAAFQVHCEMWIIYLLYLNWSVHKG